MEYYLKLDKDTIMSRILNYFNKDKVDEVKASNLLNNNTSKFAICEHFKSIYMFCMTKMTTGFFKNYMIEGLFYFIAFYVLIQVSHQYYLISFGPPCVYALT
jgi:hypothetical protein